MQCSKIRESLVNGEIPAGIDEHLLACEDCAALVMRRFADQNAPAIQLEPMFLAVVADLEKERGLAAWLRSRPTRIRLLLAGAAGVSILLLAVGFDARPDVRSLPADSTLALLLYSIALLLLAVELLRPMHRPQRPMLARALGYAAFGLPVLVPWLLAGDVDAGPAAARSGCLWLGLGVAAPSLMLLGGLDRNPSARLGPMLLAVSAAALVGNLALVLCCPSNNPSHLLRSHAPIGLALGLGYLGLRRVARVPGRQVC
jgi:hypothetical protein